MSIMVSNMISREISQETIFGQQSSHAWTESALFFLGELTMSFILHLRPLNERNIECGGLPGSDVSRIVQAKKDGRLYVLLPRLGVDDSRRDNKWSKAFLDLALQS